MTAILVPTKKSSEGDLMKLAQLMFDKKVATDRRQYAKRQEALTKMAKLRAYTNDTVGQHEMFVDTQTFWHWRKTNPGCWEDEGFIKEFKRDNPEVVRKRPDGWTPKYISVDGFKEKGSTYTINDKRCVKLDNAISN